MDGTQSVAADVGKAFEDTIQAKLRDAQDQPFGMWDAEKMLAKEVNVVGAVVQPFHDAVMPRFGVTGATPSEPGSPRHHKSVRQLIPPTPAQEMAAYLSRSLSPAMIRSIEPVFQLTWRDSNETPLLHLSLPMKVAGAAEPAPPQS
jgi:hypothetical protein